MGINNPQEECPDLGCRHCGRDIGDQSYAYTPYQMIGFCTIVCEALWLRRHLIATEKYNTDTGEINA